MDDESAARERIHNETTTGAVVEAEDGTRIVNGIVVTAGPLAIVSPEGKLLGWKPADLAGAEAGRS